MGGRVLRLDAAAEPVTLDGEWMLAHRVSPTNGLAVFGGSDAPCPPVTVASCEASADHALAMELRAPATAAARLRIAGEATGETHRVAAGTVGTLRLSGVTPVWAAG